MKKVLPLILLCVFILCGCGERSAQSVSFYDISGAMSPEKTISIKFSEEKEYKDFYSDILIKGQEENQTFSVKKEFEEPVDITLLNKNQWYSLTVLMNRAKGINTDTFTKYQEISEIVLIFANIEGTSFTLKTVIGEIEEARDGGFLLANKEDSSKEYVVRVSVNNEK